MKKLMFTIVAASFALCSVAFADQAKECCKAKVEAKVETKVAKEAKKDCCQAKVEAKVAQEAKKECCQAKVEAKVAKEEKKACCAEKVEAKVAKEEKKACCQEKVEAKVAQSGIAHGKEACCKSTAAKPQAKGEGDCCNAPGQFAKFKVFAEGKYHYFGCEDSAAAGRNALVAQGYVGVGKVQKVRGKVKLAEVPIH